MGVVAGAERVFTGDEVGVLVANVHSVDSGWVEVVFTGAHNLQTAHVLL